MIARISRTVQPIRSQSDRNAIDSYLMNKNPRDRVMFALGIYTGRRISDLVRLDIRDVAYIDRKGRLCICERLVIQERKTGKFADQLIHPKLRRILSKYLRYRRKYSETLGALLNEPLLKSRQVSRNGQRRITRRHALRVLSNAAHECGLPGLYKQLSGLQEQANKNAEAEMRNALNLHEEAERRRDIGETVKTANQYLQLQVDEIIHTILENAVNLHDEVIRRKISENDERKNRVYEDTALQVQINTAVHGILQNTLNLSNALSRHREALTQETITRTKQDAGILAQVKSLALANVQHVLDTAAMNAERRHEEAQERQTRYEEDGGLQVQINQIAFASMWLAVREHETRQKVNKLESGGSISTRPATDEEFDEMLDNLYNNP